MKKTTEVAAKNKSYSEDRQFIDYSIVNVCKKFRNLAKLDRIKLYKTIHRSGLNKHLFSYVEYCGLDMLTFVKQYLSNLQPYMLTRFTEQEKEEKFICVLDELYRVSVYIKADTTQFEEVVISFHENNKRGIAKTNSLIRRNSTALVPVIADCELGRISDSDRCVIKVFMQRGLLVLPLELPALRCKNNVYLVDSKVIEQSFVSYCNDYIRDLYTSDLELDFDKIEVFSILQQISFTSYGRDTFSSFSLLVDNLTIQPDFISRCAADMALVTFARQLVLTEDQREELLALLEEKYRVSNIKKIDIILQRIEENILIMEDN